MSKGNLWLLSSTCAAALLLSVDIGSAQTKLAKSHPGWTILNPNFPTPVAKPPSNKARPGHMHTFLDVLLPPENRGQAQHFSGPPYSGTLIETPASLACVYRLGVGFSASTGCNPNSVTTVASGGSAYIAIVDAYDYGASTAASDLAAFSTQFGLPAPNLTVIYGTGSPTNGCVSGTAPPSVTSSSTAASWAVEEALDMEAVHSMAPSAHIYLVEAAGSLNSELFNAVQVATACVTQHGVNGEQSHSWGGGETSDETAYDGYFSPTAKIAYVVSAGDLPYPYYPCASPNVICVGGTSISRNPSTGVLQSEQPWENVFGSGTGGGLSQYEPRPNFQSLLSKTVGSSRGMPDLAAAGDPYAGGMWVYSTIQFSGYPVCSSNWCAVGGTSESSPLLSGILNHAGFFYSKTPSALADIYGAGTGGTLAPYVTNINGGLCGIYVYNSSSYYSWGAWDPQNEEAVSGYNYNLCAGWGTPKDHATPD